MQTIITRACNELGIKAIPSKRVRKRGLWLIFRRLSAFLGIGISLIEDNVASFLKLLKRFTLVQTNLSTNRRAGVRLRRPLCGLVR